MSFIEQLRKERGDGRAGPSGSRAPQTDGDRKMPFVQLLREKKQEALKHSADPWTLQLERMHGEAISLGQPLVTHHRLKTRSDLHDHRSYQGEARAGEPVEAYGGRRWIDQDKDHQSDD
jgi:hypothetical protein